MHVRTPSFALFTQMLLSLAACDGQTVGLRPGEVAGSVPDAEVQDARAEDAQSPDASVPDAAADAEVVVGPDGAEYWATAFKGAPNSVDGIVITRRGRGAQECSRVWLEAQPSARPFIIDFAPSSPCYWTMVRALEDIDAPCDGQDAGSELSSGSGSLAFADAPPARRCIHAACLIASLDFALYATHPPDEADSHSWSATDIPVANCR